MHTGESLRRTPGGREAGGEEEDERCARMSGALCIVSEGVGHPPVATHAAMMKPDKKR